MIEWTGSEWIRAENTTGYEPPQPCGICSNGSALVFHIGGPCPYAYPKPRTCPHCGQEI